jgi:hypothetical protein
MDSTIHFCYFISASKQHGSTDWNYHLTIT